MAKSDTLKHVPISQIRENPIALRQVNKDCEEYTGLVDSIKRVGVMLPITVRQVNDPETGQKFFSLIDGLHRYNAAQDAGLEEIPAHVMSMDEVQVLEAQLMANIHKVETRPVEYSKQLDRILSHNPTMTAAELSVKLGKSPTWVGQRLGLVKLVPSIQKLADDGTINLTNAIAMSKLPGDEQPNFVERAMTMQPAEFTPTVNARVKEIRDAKREGRSAAPSEYVPVPHLRKLGEIKGELENAVVGAALIKAQELRKPSDVWAACIQWVLSVDSATVEISKAKHEARKAEGEANKQKRADERAAAKAAKAVAAQAQVASAVA